MESASIQQAPWNTAFLRQLGNSEPWFCNLDALVWDGRTDSGGPTFKFDLRWFGDLVGNTDKTENTQKYQYFFLYFFLIS